MLSQPRPCTNVIPMVATFLKTLQLNKHGFWNDCLQKYFVVWEAGKAFPSENVASVH